ncbi:MAG: NAD(P)H-hydrate dehydratase [Deltaproteobacteria bacterium]|nr:NAD(P)H-hydrate dehydratase [Deltaproteobacteria bacterium]
MAVPVLTAAAMREVDRTTVEEIGIPGAVLMEQAGRACAEAVESLLPDGRVARVVVFCGKGNNGGDGFVAARYLLCAGNEVEVVLLAEADGLKGSARANYEILERLGLHARVLRDEKALAEIDLAACDVVLDAIFGTGLSSEVRGLQAAAIAAINASGRPVVAVDLPSGLEADSGRVLGCAVDAVQAVTFGALKRAHLLFPGAELCGDVSLVDIGFPPQLIPQGPGSCWLVTDEDLRPHFRPRAPDAHKGHFGHLLVLAGSADKPGAAALCCRAAVRAGAGLVTLGAAPEVLPRAVAGGVEFMGQAIESPEALQAACQGKQALAIGPGLGTDERAAALVREAVGSLDLPAVVDADGLNNLVGRLDVLSGAPAARVLTPHPGEMARLMGASSAEVQIDRPCYALRLADQTSAVVVLKGAHTLVADPDGTLVFVVTGNPGMASGGTGDVLTGIIGAFLAQGMEPFDAACAGAHIHGLAGDRAAGRRGQRGLAAADLISCLPDVLRGFEGIEGSGEADGASVSDPDDLG